MEASKNNYQTPIVQIINTETENAFLSDIGNPGFNEEDVI